ncbi:hypothetical protein ACFQ3T_15445, partial [Saccharothrix hoggarensis]
PPQPVVPSPPPPPVRPPPPGQSPPLPPSAAIPSAADLDMPERRATRAESVDNTVRDQRRWGLTAIILILGASALARQAANRRR